MIFSSLQEILFLLNKIYQIKYWLFICGPMSPETVILENMKFSEKFKSKYKNLHSRNLIWSDILCGIPELGQNCSSSVDDNISNILNMP